MTYEEILTPFVSEDIPEGEDDAETDTEEEETGDTGDEEM